VAAPAGPGTPRSTAESVSLVVVTANMPRRSANAATGSMPKVKGKSSEKPISPPSPGMAPR
jgi:hypothetical protein